ncbi:glycosyltransferase family 87 protein [Actinokineospora enzanensis]|uniref:glycosyltransferase family 87 protein n=1 Tax=Actinokineospora enzanensis TaxID=155975 RepID=UPI00035F3D44|nr:glycosyltransferase family 87 protein [Actinokineospora enzanensis]
MPYGTLPCSYPPFSLLPFGFVLAWYPLGAFVFTAGSAAAMFHILLLVLGRLRQAPPHRVLVAAVGTVCAMELQPLLGDLFWGQVNVFLLWLVAVDCLHRDPRWPRGLLVGVVAAIKLTPLVFVLFFLLGRQVRPASVAVAGFAAGTGIGWLAAPHDSLVYWTRAGSGLSSAWPWRAPVRSCRRTGSTTRAPPAGQGRISPAGVDEPFRRTGSLVPVSPIWTR